MKVELRRSLDGYYEELDAVTRKFRIDLHAVKTDKSLSGFGKERRAEELRRGLSEKLAELRGKFDDDVAGRVSGIGAARGRVTEIRRRIGEGERFVGQESLFYALMGSIDELREDINRSTFVGAASRLLGDDMARVFGEAVERRDVKRLEWLKEAAALTGRDAGAFAKSVDAQIERIEESRLTPEQKRLRETAGELAKQKELFEYSVERAIAAEGEFVDLRGEDVKG
jgi:hypothetical protein